MDKIDFVIPLHCRNIIIRTVVEGLLRFYAISNIYIVTSKTNIKYLEKDCHSWEKVNNNIVFLDEEIFFVQNYHLTKETIKKWYVSTDKLSREFGWWFQQLIKLGAVFQIDDLSDPYMVWDSDLIVINPWKIYPDFECPNYRFAILQKEAKNESNKEQYALSIFELLEIEAIEPTQGTFVPHHFVFHHNVIKSMMKYIMEKEKFKDYSSWIACIMMLSHKYYRFSEYKCVATYMHHYFPHLLCFHDFYSYGKTGIRYRDCNSMLNEIKSKAIVDDYGLSYEQFKQFVLRYYKIIPSYIQLEHLIM